MKMTYFNLSKHKYHRVIFEFTDIEMKAASFEKISFNPNESEILQLLNRLAEAEKLQVDWELTFEEDNGADATSTKGKVND